MGNLNFVRVLLSLAGTLLAEEVEKTPQGEERESLVDMLHLVESLPTMAVDHVKAVSAGEYNKGKPRGGAKEGEALAVYAVQRMKDRRGI